MRYQVPQFIDVEDKIVGPLTLKQFLYIAGGAGMAYVVYAFFPLFIAIVIIGIIIPVSLALAFYKINNKPFIDFLESAFIFYTKENLYIWKKEQKKITPEEMKAVIDPKQVYVPRLSDSKLKDLSWTLDVNENLNPLTGQNGIKTK